MSLNRISSKLAIVGLSFTLPIATMLSLMIADKQKDITFSYLETLGNAYQKPLEGVMESLSTHRLLVQRANFGDAESEKQLAAIRQTIESRLQILNEVDKKIGADLQFTAEGLGKRSREQFTAEKLTTELQKFISQDTKQIQMADYSRFFSHIRTMITHSGDTSNLILDPDLDSYYLMDVSLLALPQIQDRLQDMAVFVENIHDSGVITDQQRIQASVYAAFLREADLDRIILSSQTALNEDQNFFGLSDSLQKTLPLGMQLLKQNVEPIIASLTRLAQAESPKQLNRTEFRQAIDLALVNVYSYHALSFVELNRLLDVRIDDIKANKLQAILWTTVSLIFSFLLFLVIATSIIRRVGKISQATRLIADGNLTARVGIQGGDELGQLARSFDQMTDNVEHLTQEIARKNADLQDVNQNLEAIVAERTKTINTILDNVKFGFLLIDRDLKMREGFSKSCNELLHHSVKLQSGQTFREIFQLQNHRNVALYEAFIEQAFEDFLPEEMTLRQVPNRLRIGERMLSLQVTAVRSAQVVESLLFTITDATNLEKAERENSRHKVLVRLLREMDSFRNYMEEIKTRLTLSRKLVQAGEQHKVRGELHTIKGNTAAFDLLDIAKLVHDIEDMAEIDLAAIERIEKEFELFLEENFEILQMSFNGEAQDSNTLQIEQKHLDDIVGRMKKTKSNDEVLSTFHDWVAGMRYKQARVLIGALPEYGERLAARFEKAIHIRFEGADVRMDPDVMRPIMNSLIHLVRNSIDHGLESPHEREMAGKPELGTITIYCQDLAQSWIVGFTDDGRGINVAKIVQKVLEKGQLTEGALAAMSPEQKLSLIFLSGMSTSESITDISGRGVGMSAIQNAVADAGGQLTVASQEGQGTSIRIEIPKVRQDLYLKAS